MYPLNADRAPVGGHSFKDLNFKEVQPLWWMGEGVLHWKGSGEDFHPAERLAGYSKMKNCECRMQRKSSARGGL